MVNADTIKNTLVFLSIKQHTAAKILLQLQPKAGSSCSAGLLSLFQEWGRRNPLTHQKKAIGKRRPTAAQHFCLFTPILFRDGNTNQLPGPRTGSAQDTSSVHRLLHSGAQRRSPLTQPLPQLLGLWWVCCLGFFSLFVCIFVLVLVCCFGFGFVSFILTPTQCFCLG